MRVAHCVSGACSVCVCVYPNPTTPTHKCHNHDTNTTSRKFWRYHHHHQYKGHDRHTTMNNTTTQHRAQFPHDKGFYAKTRMQGPRCNQRRCAPWQFGSIWSTTLCYFSRNCSFNIKGSISYTHDFIIEVTNNNQRSDSKDDLVQASISNCSGGFFPIDGRKFSDIPKLHRYTDHYQLVACAHVASEHIDRHDFDRRERPYAIRMIDDLTDTRRESHLYLQQSCVCSSPSWLAVYHSDFLAWQLLHDQQLYRIACTHTSPAFSTLHYLGSQVNRHSVFLHDSDDTQRAAYTCHHLFSDKQPFMHAPNHHPSRYLALLPMSSHSIDGTITKTSADAAHGWIPTGECASVEPSTTAVHGWIPTGECTDFTADANSNYSHTGTRRPHQYQRGRVHGHHDHGVESWSSIQGTCADAHGWIPPGECASVGQRTSTAHGWIPTGECAPVMAQANRDESHRQALSDSSVCSPRNALIEPVTSDAHGWIPTGECAKDAANASRDHNHPCPTRRRVQQEGSSHGQKNQGMPSGVTTMGTKTDGARGWIPPGECAPLEPTTSAAHGWIPTGECAPVSADASSDYSDMHATPDPDLIRPTNPESWVWMRKNEFRSWYRKAVPNTSSAAAQKEWISRCMSSSVSPALTPLVIW